MLLVSIGLTALLYAIPFGRTLAYPLMLLSTLAHELGHGVAALTVGGSFHRFVMWPDGSGMATWSGDVGRLGRAWVAAGGLIGPAIVAAVGFAAGRTARGAKLCLAAFSGLLALALILVVRNLFGVLFVLILLSLGILVARRSRGEAAQLLLVFIAVQLALSVFSRGDYLFTPTARTAGGPMPSDVGQISQDLFLPYWFWGGVCGLLSVAVLAFGVRVFWRHGESPSARIRRKPSNSQS
jgi:hypothetical protein